MFNIIKKTEYWEALDNKKVYSALRGGERALDGLKHIQDYWIMNQLIASKGLKICEIGGANSRIIPALNPNNECWNLDEFKGVGNGPTMADKIEDVKYVFANLGDFASDLPDNYFDVSFSISVIEHIPQSDMGNFWKDNHRIMKKGGKALHVIDIYIGNNPNLNLERKIDQYIYQPLEFGFSYNEEIQLKRPAVFTCDMASNSDWGMWRWNKISPLLVKSRSICQSVSIALILKK
jgi:hypothetical protein